MKLIYQIKHRIKFAQRYSQYCQDCCNPNHRRRMTYNEMVGYVCAYIGVSIGNGIFNETEPITSTMNGDAKI